MVAALLAGLVAASAAAAPDLAGWGEGVLWPLARYAHDLAVGEGVDRVGLLEADAASAVVLRVSVEPLMGGGYRVHNLGPEPAAVDFAAARADEDAHRAELDAVLARHRADLGLPFAPAARDWLAELSAALHRAAPDPAAVVADWRFFGFRRGGVVDLPGLGARSRAQTLRMLRALAADSGGSAPFERRRAALRAVWLEAQRSAHPTQYMLTGPQARAAALALHPGLPALAAAGAPPEAELPWGELLALASDELRPWRRGDPAALWMAVDADAARTLAEAGALLARGGFPAAARPAAPPAPAAPALFADATSTGNFVSGSRDALDIVTSGAAVLDYDRDGLPDLWVGYAVARGGTLWRNLGGMRFREVTAELGFGPGGQRAAPADFDGDGWTDLLVLGDNESDTRLWLNRGGKRFTDATDRLGPKAPRGIAETGLWFDADGDGDLDLYLVYLGRAIDRVGPAADGANGQPNELFLNDGGRLRRATAGSGLEDPHWGWAAQAFDADGDGDEDVFLCNLWGASRLLLSDGRGRFSEAAAGLGPKTLCRGAAAADADGDGRPDLFVSAGTGPQALFESFASTPPRPLTDQAAFTQGYGGAVGSWQEDALHLASGGGAFREASSTTLEGRAGMSWSPLLDDLDLDGDEDMYLVNGFYPDTLFFHDEVKLLRLGRGDGTFAAAPAGHGADFLGTSRSSLTADFDADGCPDLFVAGLHGPRLLKGLCPGGRRALRLRLEAAGPNRDAVGARVELELAGGARRTLRWGPYGGGQVSSFWGERLVGLGPGGRAERVRVAWPGGGREDFGPFAAGEKALLRRGAGRKADDGRR